MFYALINERSVASVVKLTMLIKDKYGFLATIYVWMFHEFIIINK